MYDRLGKSSQVSFGRKESSAAEFMAQLKRAIPWAILGYSDEIAKMRNKDRAQLINLVDQRRNQGA